MITIYSLPGMPQRYALGLAWRHVDGAPGVAERRALTTTDTRWGVVRKTSANPATYQVGYGALPEGTKNVSSVRPLALYVADMHVPPWLGVFKLEDDRYWLLAVRDNNEIIPEGDVVGPRDAIEAAREQMLALASWDQVVDGGVEMLIEQIILRGNQRALRDLRTQLTPATKVVLAALGLATVAGGGVLAYHLHSKRLEEAAYRDLLTRQAAQRAKEEAELNTPPWLNSPRTPAVFAACRDAWAQSELTRDGWQLVSWNCSVQGPRVSISADWRRVTGLASQAPGTLTGPDTSTEQRLGPAVANATDDHVDAGTDTALRAVYSVGQANGLKMNVAADRGPVASVPGQPPAPQLPWANHTFSAIAPFAPWIGLTNAFDSVRGLRPSVIAWTFDRQEWEVRGSVFNWTSSGRGTARSRAQAANRGAVKIEGGRA
ncbi:type 4b pilus protein PilO2 [Burkholderia cenocepacia]|uniref:type 4b pilus protein PilO2 n=1 Tax=Burkholderia cenocepacia TaxID=95486 RepID=UPI000F56F1FF|nr:type 4b pilus protein PilO2 [Burkholderia cenocepacia]RQU97799.1 hypothetical protein DF042_27160 [Burkholderia cenocepacia]